MSFENFVLSSSETFLKLDPRRKMYMACSISASFLPIIGPMLLHSSMNSFDMLGNFDFHSFPQTAWRIGSQNALNLGRQYPSGLPDLSSVQSNIFSSAFFISFTLLDFAISEGLYRFSTRFWFSGFSP